MKDAAESSKKRPGMFTGITDQDAADQIERTPGSFGVTSYAVVASEKRNIKPLAVDGISPVGKHGANEKYPYFMTLYLVYVERQEHLGGRKLHRVHRLEGRRKNSQEERPHPDRESTGQALMSEAGKPPVEPRKRVMPIGRLIGIIGWVVTALIAVAIPTVYYTLAIKMEMESLRIETAYTAKEIQSIAFARPDLWVFESERILEIVSKRTVEGEEDERTIYDASGKILAETKYKVPARKHNQYRSHLRLRI